ncbi:O-antigen ligase family protein [Algicella marina]|uniref:O-antigen ligase-related domain-containing protein n=1 Tax=Algicella marina TaxID=2683284 RepID=A0A6P1T1G7_9RHOB|nr:O-antigen ligase family protein [Algicella marina]QHQ35605.1 hypothetical protein GO499_10660 [Algicella marina]
MTDQSAAPERIDGNGTGQPAAPMILPWAYAIIPSLGAVIWLLAGPESSLRVSGMPMEFLPLIYLLAMFTALRSGLSRDNFLRIPSLWDRVPLALFLALSAVTLALVAVDPVHGLAELGTRMLIVITGVFVSYLIWKFGPSFEAAMTWSVFLHVVAHLPFLLIFYILYIGDPALNWKGGPIGYWHVRIWGMFLAAAIAVGVGLTLRNPNRGERIALWSVIAVLIGLLFWSGSRAPILGLGIAGIMTFALFPRRTLPALLPLVLAGGVGIALSFLPEVPNSAYGVLNSLEETVASEDVDGSSGGRVTMWRDALVLVAERPLFGHGFDQYRFVNFGRFEWALQPHNELINFLVQSGVIGSLLIVFVALRFWVKALLRVRRSDSAARIGAFTALNTLIVISFFDGSLYHPQPLTLAALLAALCLHPGADVDSTAKSA